MLVLLRDRALLACKWEHLDVWYQRLFYVERYHDSFLMKLVRIESVIMQSYYAVMRRFWNPNWSGFSKSLLYRNLFICRMTSFSRILLSVFKRDKESKGKFRLFHMLTLKGGNQSFMCTPLGTKFLMYWNSTKFYPANTWAVAKHKQNILGLLIKDQSREE